MSRKARPRRSPPRRDTPAPRSRHAAWALGITLAVALSAGVAMFAIGRGLPRRPRMELPAPSEALDHPPRDTVRHTDFVGSEACASCHQAEFAMWKSSTHARAGGTPSPERLIAAFDGKPIRFSDAIVTPAVRGGAYVFIVEQQEEPTRVFQVNGVIGGGHMVGGGTQGFVSRFPDGTMRFLPFDFVRKEGVWFCNTGSRSQPGYHPITPRMRLAECGDWPPIRVLGDAPRFANCQGCHGSQIDVAFDARQQAYQTRYTTLAINCESCHGPGRKHIEVAGSGRIGTAEDIGMQSLAVLPKDASLQVCFQCHALKDRVKPGYLPGKSLREHYSTLLALLGDEPLHADGRVRTFGYQENQLYSACYRNGSMTCTSCHDPHSQRYRDVNGAELPGRFDDRQCTSCHASKAERIEAHTHHPAASPGSRCVSCHMPYLQHPEAGTAIRFARSDHTIPIPRPAFDERLGVRDACSQCHADRSVASIQRAVEEWYGAVKPHPPLIAGLLAAREESDPARLAKLLLQPAPDHTIAQFAALSRYVEVVLRPDMPMLDREAEERLKALAGSSDADVRALALAALHYARGEDRRVRKFLRDQLASLGGDDETIRRRWVIVLGYLGDRSRASGDPASAIAAYRKALEILPQESQVLANAGLAYGDVGDLASAEQLYRRSLERDPLQPLTLVNLGNILRARGDAAGAVAAYRQALAVDPREPLASFNLGNVYLERGEAANAVEMYRRALQLDPSLVAGHLNLARAYALLGNAVEARAALVRALEFDPSNSDGREMLAALERVLQGR